MSIAGQKEEKREERREKRREERRRIPIRKTGIFSMNLIKKEKKKRIKRKSSNKTEQPLYGRYRMEIADRDPEKYAVIFQFQQNKLIFN